MLKKTKAFIAMLTALVLYFTSVGMVFGADNNTDENSEQNDNVSVEDIIADSEIYYIEFSRFLNHGEIYDVDKSSNKYINMDGVDYIELSWVCDIFDLSYYWDGKSSSLVFIRNKTNETFKVKSTTADEKKKDEKVGLFLDDYTLIPVEVLSNEMGFHYFKCDEFWAISQSYELENIVDLTMKNKIVNKGKTVEMFYDFDESSPELTPMYAGGCTADTFAEPCQTNTEDNNTYLQIGATFMGNGGFNLPLAKYDLSNLYTVEFDATKSTDFSGSGLRLYVHAYQNGKFLKYIDGIYNTPKTAGIWTHYTLAIKPELIPAGTTDILVIPATNAVVGEKVSGKIMFDNIKLTSYPVPTDNTVTPNITADKVGSWYVLGDTVTMTPTNKIDTGKYPQMVVDIYDSDNNLVHSETVETAKFNNGYKWKPAVQGYYGYDFFTINKDGIKEDLNEFYVKKDSKLGKDVKFYIDRNYIVVAKQETKPMEERSGRLAISMDTTLILDSGRVGGFQGDQIEIADKVGFKKMRFHFLRPDGRAYAKKSLSNPTRGKFDFSEWDESVTHANKYGFDLILNLMGVPRYSTPYRSGVNAPDGTPAMSYMPVNIEAWNAFVEYAVKRYKNNCHIWEIWNEPNLYGQSVFWHGTTTDYAKLQKSAYDIIKKYQPGDKSEVLLGGIGARRYVGFYEEFVQTEGYEAFDLLPLHGYDVDYWIYQKIAKDYDKEPKRICSTEMHMMLRDKSSEYINNTDKEEAIRMIVEFLKDFKYGAEFTTFFQIYASCDVDWIRYVKEHGLSDGSLEGGLYNVGHKQPRIAAIALNTFFETIGKQYDYVDEYLVANNKQNVVRVNSDGNDQLIVWNVGGSKANETILSKQITDAATSDFKVIDWEGHDIDTSDLENITIKPEKMYFISGLDTNKLDLIESAQGEETYTGKVLYNATEKQKTDVTLKLDHVVANGSTEPLFDKNSFTLKDDINYVDDGWYWVANTEDAQQGDFDAKYALSMAEDGMYLVVKVNDTTDNPSADSAANINLRDSIQFAFDTAGNRSDNGYMECYVGLVGDKPVVYKKTAPHIGGDIIPGFIESENEINDAVVSRTVDGSEVTYKVFLPKKEIYPYVINTNEAMHFTVLANQNDGNENVGYIEWASGTGKEKDPIQYGDVWFDSEAVADNDVYYPLFAKGNNKSLFNLDTLEFVDDINWIESGYNWVRLKEDDPNFKPKFAVGVTDEGVYIAAEVEDGDISAGATKANGLWGVDSMQFAMDVEGRGISNNRFEFQFGKLADGSVAIIKDAAPFYTDAAKPEGYSNSNTVLTDCVTDVHTENGKIIYKLFIPISELYPFNPSESKLLKMSFLFNQNKGAQRIGYTEWSSGIGGTKDAKQYGIIRYR